MNKLAKFKSFSLPTKVAVVLGSFIGAVVGFYVVAGIVFFTILEVQYILRSVFGMTWIHYI